MYFIGAVTWMTQGFVDAGSCLPVAPDTTGSIQRAQHAHVSARMLRADRGIPLLRQGGALRTRRVANVLALRSLVSYSSIDGDSRRFTFAPAVSSPNPLRRRSRSSLLLTVFLLNGEVN